MGGTTAPQTPGEVAFEAYLRSQGITDFLHEKPFPGQVEAPRLLGHARRP